MKDGDVAVYSLVAGPHDAPLYVGYVVLGGEFLGVRFEGRDGLKVSEDAKAFYEEKRIEREEAARNREIGRIKAAETAARKASKAPSKEDQ